MRSQRSMDAQLDDHVRRATRLCTHCGRGCRLFSRAMGDEGAVRLANPLDDGKGDADPPAAPPAPEESVESEGEGPNSSREGYGSVVQDGYVKEIHNRLR